MAEVKVLLWDLGGVLIPFSHARLWRNFLGILPLRKSISFFWRRDALQKRLFKPLDDFERGLCSFDDLKDAVEKELKVSLDREKFRLAWNDIFGLPGETAAFARTLHEKHPCYVLMTMVLAPSASNTLSAMLQAAPFATSRPTRLPCSA